MKEKRIIILILLIAFGIFLVSADGNGTNQSNSGANASVNKTIEAIKIIDIAPHEVPMLVPVNFVVLVEGNGSYDYRWDFGDGVTGSGSNRVEHAYSSLGLYEIEVRVFNSSDSVSKGIYISVVSPVSSVNKTIDDFKNKLGGIEKEVDKLPDWVADEINSMIGLDELKNKIEEQENKTKDGVSEQEAVDIMGKLYELEIPERFVTGLIVNKVSFVMDVGRIDLDALKESGAGSFKEEREKYDKAISSWVRESLELKVESKSYKLYYEDKEEDLVSYIKVSLIPKKNLSDVYFIIDSNDIKSGEFENYGDDMGKKLVGLKKGGEISFEFLVPEKTKIASIPVYISPKESELNLEVVVGVCNNDGLCDEGENYNNCPNDCKRWFGSGLMLIGLLIIAFIVYIILQEWYKVYYERHLFPDRNQLFNLVHFMNNSSNQGLGRGDIFSKLKDIGWKGEQLDYAWKKLHGKRTGMWEIPVLKWWENREVERELEKRGSRIGYREFKR